MNKFTAKTFDIPKLIGISSKTIEEHLKLYAGYVNNANLIGEKIIDLKTNTEKNSYAISELMRRFSFEYNGMRNHEIYFNSFVSGPTAPNPVSELNKLIAISWGSFDSWLDEFKSLAMTRGIGWAMLYFDPNENRLINSWVDEQHIGQLQNCAPIIALDMWEHSFVADYLPSGKKNYINDFFSHLNWQTPENNFAKIVSR